MKKYTYLLLLTLIISSCGTTLHTGGDTIYPKKPLLNVESLNGELIVDKSKVLSGISKSTTYFMIFKTGDNTFLEAKFMGPASSKTKKAAMYKALENSGNDIIVNPKYIIQKTKSLFGLIKSETVQVSGYGAKINITD
tara:strand:- start:277 stop:690 length:414 start_codon:yes stop_codon:yes gene_type:complete